MAHYDIVWYKFMMRHLEFDASFSLLTWHKVMLLIKAWSFICDLNHMTKNYLFRLWVFCNAMICLISFWNVAHIISVFSTFTHYYLKYYYYFLLFKRDFYILSLNLHIDNYPNTYLTFKSRLQRIRDINNICI